MKQKLPTRRMRQHPDLEQLKRQAKELQQSFLAGEAAAIAEIDTHYRAANPSKFALHDAQLVIARSYGFDSWPKLKAYVDGVTVSRLADAIGADDLTQVEAMLHARPEIANLAMSYGDEHRPIHHAVARRSPRIVRLLMRHGANARQGIHPHRDATTAWTIASERGYDEIVAIIEEEEQRRQSKPADDPPKPELLGDETARAAAASGDIEWLRARHAEGNLVNPIRWNDGGLLTVAVDHNKPDVLRLLLDYGFDPDEHVSYGEGDWVAYSQGYPLWHCAALGRRELAEMLLERGASPNVHVDSSGSAVYSAYSHKQWEMVELLRQHGGVVSADIAAIYHQTDLVRQILADHDRGMLAEGVISDKPLAEELFRSSNPEIVRMALERIDWPRDDPRWFGILTDQLYFWHHIPWLYAGNREVDRKTYLSSFLLILNRCDPNVIGAFARTALHEVAAMRDHVTEEEAVMFAKALMNAGARTDIRDDILKSTPLGWACRWGRADVARVLLERGADPVEADAEPWAQPKAWAEKMGHTAVLAVLGYGTQ
jgi:ankyrin repeat protein